MKVYLITNKVNGKQYVGITVQELRERFKQHARYSGMVINSAIKKHGKENFTIELLEECTSIEELREKETYYIKTLNTMTPRGYNVAGGGEGLAEEARYKISKALLGKKKSPEHVENIRKAQLGRTQTEETREKLRKINLGKKYSEETQLKKSNSLKRFYEQNPNANSRIKNAQEARKVKLTVTQRDEILQKIADGGILRHIAKEYGVSYDTIRDIKYGRHWLCKEGVMPND